MSGVLNPRSRDELSKARVKLIDKITEFANAGSWPEDMVLVAAVLAALREDTEAGDKIAMQLARRLPGRSVEGGGQFEVAEWIALLRRAEAMDAALALEAQADGGMYQMPTPKTWLQIQEGAVERSLQRSVDGMDRIMMFTGKVDGTEPTVVLRGEPKTGQSWWSGSSRSDGDRP